jgi:hypothetical protein
MIVTLGVLMLVTGSVLATDVAKPAALPAASPGQAAGPVYIVDQNNPKASDDNPGTVAAPWKTIGKAAATAKAGDTICVMEGTYAEQIKFANSGAAGKPIVIKSVPRYKAIVKGKTTKEASPGFVTTGCNYLRIESFTIEDMDSAVIVDSNCVEVVDNHFDNAELSAVDVKDVMPSETPAQAYIGLNRMYQCNKGAMSGGRYWLVERNEVVRLKNFARADSDYTRPFGCNQVFRQNWLHGSFPKEILGAHVDGFQVFDNNGYVARDNLIEDNVVSEFHQGQMMEVHTPGTIKNFTYRRNIFFQRGKDAGWAYAGLNGGCDGELVDRNTFVGGGCDAGPTITYQNNLFYSCLYQSPKEVAKNPNDQRNLIFYPTEGISLQGLSHRPMPYEKNVMNKDPLFQNLSGDNVRLKKGSPAIGAGLNGATIGALDYPNVYYVDIWHGGASDNGYGYPGAPYKTVAKALAVAEDGETIILRGGVYRELVKPTKPGVTIKAMKDEKVVISGADEITGWNRDGDKWTAPLAAKPSKVLKDGKPFAEFTYDDAAKTIAVTGFDPRLALLETVVRQNAIDLSAAPGTKFADIKTADTLGEGQVK